MEDECIFCNRENSLIENKHAYARYDKYPVNDGHILVILKRHVSNYFHASDEEKLAVSSLIEQSKVLLDKEKSPDGYNIGINCGEIAGQTVMHAHVHLIPRYKGDVMDPKGGVRGVIPSKQKY